MSQSEQPAAVSDQVAVDELAADAVEPQAAVAEFTFLGWLWGFAQRTFLLLGIYVLSIGPMYWKWYAAHYADGSETLARFYEPLVIMARLIPPFGRWMDWYVGLWIG